MCIRVPEEQAVSCIPPGGFQPVCQNHWETLQRPDTQALPGATESVNGVLDPSTLPQCDPSKCWDRKWKAVSFISPLGGF